jgi:hypothetical protein
VDFRAVDFLRVAGFLRAVVFLRRAGDLRAVVFLRAAGFLRAVVFLRPVALRAVDLARLVVFRAVDLALRVVLRAVDLARRVAFLAVFFALRVVLRAELFAPRAVRLARAAVFLATLRDPPGVLRPEDGDADPGDTTAAPAPAAAATTLRTLAVVPCSEPPGCAISAAPSATSAIASLALSTKPFSSAILLLPFRAANVLRCHLKAVRGSERFSRPLLFNR